MNGKILLALFALVAAASAIPATRFENAIAEADAAFREVAGKTIDDGKKAAEDAIKNVASDLKNNLGGVSGGTGVSASSGGGLMAMLKNLFHTITFHMFAGTAHTSSMGGLASGNPIAALASGKLDASSVAGLAGNPAALLADAKNLVNKARHRREVTDDKNKIAATDDKTKEGADKINNGLAAINSTAAKNATAAPHYSCNFIMKILSFIVPSMCPPDNTTGLNATAATLASGIHGNGVGVGNAIGDKKTETVQAAGDKNVANKPARHRRDTASDGKSSDGKSSDGKSSDGKSSDGKSSDGGNSDNNSAAAKTAAPVSSCNFLMKLLSMIIPSLCPSGSPATGATGVASGSNGNGDGNGSGSN